MNDASGAKQLQKYQLQVAYAESARMDTVATPSSCWVDVQPEILIKIFAALPLADGFACEKVCTVWRHALLSGPLAGQNKGKALVLLHAVGRSQLYGDSSASVAKLNISDQKDGLATWLSKRGSAFDVICFGTAFRPMQVSVAVWHSLFGAFADTQGPQLKLSLSSMIASPTQLYTTDCDQASCSAARSSSNCFGTLHAGFHPILVPASVILRQRCTALFMDLGPGLTPEQLMAISHLSSLESLEINLAQDDYMGFLPSCWTRLSHLHSLTLNKCKAVPAVLVTLESLRSLALRFRSYSRRQCLEALSQLTSLHVSFEALHDEPMEFDISLPKGHSVQLRHLTLQMGTPIANVQCATQLTRLDMTVKVAMHLRWRWHVPLTKLKVIVVSNLESNRYQHSPSGPWPSIWQYSTSLERLTLLGWEIRETPCWMTELQQLRRLEMPQACLRDLNAADLRQLPCLEQLNLGNFCFDQLNALTPAIVECAYLPVLKWFTYGVHHDTGHSSKVSVAGETLHSQASRLLLQLQNAFVSHRLAPFHDQQRTLTTMQNLQVTVVQFNSSCDD